MSISDRHSVVPFVAGTSEAFEGQRLAKIGYKSTKKAKAKFPSVCASIPVLTSQDVIDFASYDVINKLFRETFEAAQDRVIRAAYEKAQGKLPLSLGDDEIGFDAVVELLKQEAEREGRVTMEVLRTWFDECAAENVQIALMEANKIEELEDPKILQMLAGVKELVSGLAGKEVYYTESQIKTCKRALELSVELEGYEKVTAHIEKKLGEMEKAQKFTGASF